MPQETTNRCIVCKKVILPLYEFCLKCDISFGGSRETYFRKTEDQAFYKKSQSMDFFSSSELNPPPPPKPIVVTSLDEEVSDILSDLKSSPPLEDQQEIKTVKTITPFETPKKSKPTKPNAKPIKSPEISKHKRTFKCSNRKCGYTTIIRSVGNTTIKKTCRKCNSPMREKGQPKPKKKSTKSKPKKKTRSKPKKDTKSQKTLFS